MTTEQMKNIYEANPNDWVVYYISPVDGDISKLEGSMHDNVQREYPNVYQLIHKRHEVIADEVIKNPDVVVEYDFDKYDFDEYDWREFTEFFKYYKPHHSYRLAPTEQEHKGEESEKYIGGSMGSIGRNNNIPNSSSTLDVLTITDEQGKEYRFEKPEWWNNDCKLYQLDSGRIFGRVGSNSWVWNTLGYSENKETRYDLTPIKPTIQVEKVVFYECYGNSVLESRELVEIDQEYWDKLAKEDKE